MTTVETFGPGELAASQPRPTQPWYYELLIPAGQYIRVDGQTVLKPQRSEWKMPMTDESGIRLIRRDRFSA